MTHSYEYYNANAEAFIERTFHIDIDQMIHNFTRHIPEGGRILDLGCGSGRDSKRFSQMRYDVYAVDASEKMVEHTRALIGDRVVLSTFEDYTSDIKFDGIWASASLLHVPEENMLDILRKYQKKC